MEPKHIVFLIGMLVLVPLGIAAASVSRRLREAAFFVFIFGTVLPTGAGDINFISREWYRGTTRGIEISWLDFLGLIVLASTIIAGILASRRRPQQVFFWPPALAPMLALVAYAAFNVVHSDPSIFGFFELSKLVRGLLVFLAAAMFVRSRREIELFVVALASALVFEGIVVVYDRYFLHLHRIGGTLGHPNALAFYCNMSAPILLAAALSNVSHYKKLFFGIAATCGFVGVLFTISRTGLATGGLVLFGVALICLADRIRITKKFLIRGALVSLILGAALFKVSGTIMDRVASDEAKVSERGSYYTLARSIASERPLGVGLNNWSYAVSGDYGYRVLGLPYYPYLNTKTAPRQLPRKGMEAAQAPPAHSLLALTAGELGWPGLVLMCLVWIRWFWLAAAFLWKKTTGLVSRFGIGALFGLTGAFLQSFTEWSFRQTNVFFLGHVIVGVLAAAYYWRRKEAAHVRRNLRIASEATRPGAVVPELYGRQRAAIVRRPPPCPPGMPPPPRGSKLGQPPPLPPCPPGVPASTASESPSAPTAMPAFARIVRVLSPRRSPARS